jgi:P-type Cu+ transporter
VIFVVIDGRPAGVLGVADPIKESTPEAMRALHDEGVRIVMLTGDSRTTADAVGGKLAIDEVVAEVLPDQKASVVKRLQGEGRVVAMAGDGINDAPALAAADVGLAIGTGTDVAIEAAGISLISGSLAGVVTAIGLSRATMRNIRQNLFFALAYNAIGIPIAAGILYPAFGIRLSPIIAAAAMAASSLLVVTNANRLRRYHPAPLLPASPAEVTPHVETGPAHSPGMAEHSGGHDHGGPPASHGTSGSTATDPVCGMQIDPAAAAAYRDTPEGRTWFCSHGCAAAFEANQHSHAAAATETVPGEGTR